jgi:hypothetical protein
MERRKYEHYEKTATDKRGADLEKLTKDKKT